MSAYKVVITDFADPDCLLEAEQFRAAGLDVELVFPNTRQADQLLPHIVDADALIVQWANINRSLIEAMQRCRVLSRYGIGVDMVDLVAASERGIIVANVPDFCIEEVSTHTIAFLLMLNRHIPLHSRHVRAGRWGSPQLGNELRPGLPIGVLYWLRRQEWRRLVFSGGLVQKLPPLRQLICERFACEHRLCPTAEDTLLGLLALALAFTGRAPSVAAAMATLLARAAENAPLEA